MHDVYSKVNGYYKCPYGLVVSDDHAAVVAAYEVIW